MSKNSGGGGSRQQFADPKEIARAQNSTNFGTAAANAFSNSINQYGPSGSYTSQHIGNKSYTDPWTGQTYQIPQFETQTNLNRGEQKVYDAGASARGSVASTADRLTSGLTDYLRGGITDGVSGGGDARGLRKDLSSGGTHLDITRRLSEGGDASGLRTNLPSVMRSRDIDISRGGDADSLRGNLPSVRDTDFGADHLRNLQSFGSLDDVSTGDQARKRAEKALMERLNPQLENDRSALEARLANQGITMGSEAWQQGMDDFGRQSNDARLGAIINAGAEADRVFGMDMARFNAQNAMRGQEFDERMGQFGARAAEHDATQAARSQIFGERLNQFNAQEGQRQTDADIGLGLMNADLARRGQMFGERLNQFGALEAQRGQDLSEGQAIFDAKSGARAQDFGERVTRFGAQEAQRAREVGENQTGRNQRVGEIAALLQSSPVYNPQYTPFGAPQAPTTDVASIINSMQQQQNAASQASANRSSSLFGNLLGAGGALGAAAIMSDRRLKTDIEQVGKVEGLNVYEYRYHWDSKSAPKRRGFMAQEVIKVMPDAVIPAGDFMALDYSKLPEVA